MTQMGTDGGRRQANKRQGVSVKWLLPEGRRRMSSNHPVEKNSDKAGFRVARGGLSTTTQSESGGVVWAAGGSGGGGEIRGWMRWRRRCGRFGTGTPHRWTS